MPDQIDLEPEEYREKQPILLKGWWRGILIFVLIVLFGMYVIRPLYGAYSDAVDAAWFSLFPRK